MFGLDTYKFITDKGTIVIRDISKAEKFKIKCENRGLRLRTTYRDEFGCFVWVYEK